MASSAFATTLCIAIGFCFRPAIVPGHVALVQKVNWPSPTVPSEPNVLRGFVSYLCNKDFTSTMNTPRPPSMIPRRILARANTRVVVELVDPNHLPQDN